MNVVVGSPLIPSNLPFSVEPEKLSAQQNDEKPKPIYSVHDTSDLKDFALKVASFGLKAFIFNTIREKMSMGFASAAFLWVRYEFYQYMAERLIMSMLYPAQSNIAKLVHPTFQRPKVAEKRVALEQLPQSNSELIIEKIVLQKNKNQFDGYKLGKRSTIHNGRWVLQATGNSSPIEMKAWEYGEQYLKAGFNVLLINGPNVGRSEGHATPKSMGAAQETALRCLEDEFNAKQIAIIGHSLGGAAIGQAILQHKFKEDVKYLVINQLTFDKTTNVAKEFLMSKFFTKFDGKWFVGGLKAFASGLIHWTGLQMDHVSASKKLQDLKIREVIIQVTNREVPKGDIPTLKDFTGDGIIEARATLGYGLIKHKVNGYKTFRCMKYIDDDGKRDNHTDSGRFLPITCDELKEHFGEVPPAQVAN